MTFTETVEALKALAKEATNVEVLVCGTAEDAQPFVSLGGLLAYASDPDDPDAPELSAKLREALASAETGTTFEVGSRDFTHWFGLLPSRFVSAEADEINGIHIVTRDGQLWIREDDRY